MKLKKTQHEIFAKFFETPTRETLKDIFNDNTGEKSYLDFKEVWLEHHKLAKYILASSNTGTGALIMGVKENDDKTFTSKGLDSLTDDSVVRAGLEKYLPDAIEYDIFDFIYTDSDNKKLKGKKFQVLLIEYDPCLIPFLAKKGGTDLKKNAVYIRRGTSSVEANHDELQDVLNKRIESGYSTDKEMKLDADLYQLKTLCRHLPDDLVIKGAMARMIMNMQYPGFYDFLNDAIKLKNDKILADLGTNDDD